MHEGQALGEPVEVTPSSATEIQMKAPNLSKYVSKIPPGQDRLGMDVVVTITGSEGGSEDEEQSRVQRSGEGAPNETGDGYEALSLAVESVTDEVTGTNTGSILGGDQLKIEGSGFEVPEGGTATVTFEQHGEVLGEPVTATAKGTEELLVTAPDFAKYESKIPEGKSALELTVRVTLEIGGEKIESELLIGEDEGDDTYLASEPTITSVTDEQTGTNQGSILGGDTLKIKGSGFTIPAGDKGGISFNLYGGGVVAAAGHETVLSDTEIEVTVPDLAKYEDQIPSGQNALKLELRALIEDTEDNIVASPKETAVFEALAPKVESVVDESTGTNQGSALGGSTLSIKGTGLTVPVGDEVKVGFIAKGGDAIGEDVAATPVSATELQVTVPNEAKAKDKLEAGKSALPTQVVVVIGKSASEQIQSIDHEPPDGTDTYEFLFPQVDSVVDESTGKNQGSALGGSTLSIKGTGLAVPAGGTAKIAFIPKPGELLGEEVTATAVSATELQITVPNEAKAKSKLEAGKAALGAQVVVNIANAQSENVESVDHEPAGPEDSYEFLFPQVDSVVDESTGKNQGSALGGSTLSIKGTGLAVPTGGTAKIAFIPKPGELLGEEVTATAVSATELQITVPNEAKAKSKLEAGKAALGAQVVVNIANAQSENVESVDHEPAGPEDSYEFLFPKIESIVGEKTGSDQGPILGGEILKIKGTGLSIPAGDTATATFYHGNDAASVPVAVTGVSATEVELVAPNMASFASEIPADKHALETKAILTIEDALATVSNSGEGEAGNLYEALTPTIDSVSNDTADTSNSGSIAGGEELRITGSGFNLPSVGSHGEGGLRELRRHPRRRRCHAGEPDRNRSHLSGSPQVRQQDRIRKGWSRGQRCSGS